MTTLMTVLGIVVFVLGLLVSISWHELGHLATAKMFGIRVPQYMVGFGPTLFSRRRGDTEYGLKAVPLGGYCRLIGMFPPGDDGKVTARSTSPWRSMVENARSAATEELLPGDETRMFYTRKPWQRVIVMFAGPFMNLVLAVALFLGVLMGFGISSQTTTVSSVSQCVISQSAASAGKTTCAKGDPASPAEKAGLRAGDRIVAFDGRPIKHWKTLQADIRDTTGPATVTVSRHGRTLVLRADLIKNQVAKTDSAGDYMDGKYVTAGFLGFTPAVGIVRQDFGDSLSRMGQLVSSTAGSLVDLPARIPGLWRSAFEGAPRQANSPMGVVGAARVGGDVFSLHIPSEQRVATMLMLVAGFNLSLFLFNLLPLLPLDGGHIVGALWEALKRHLARAFRRPDPGPFDVAKMMPVAYVVAGIFLSFTVLVLIADVVNPVKIT